MTDGHLLNFFLQSSIGLLLNDAEVKVKIIDIYCSYCKWLESVVNDFDFCNVTTNTFTTVWQGFDVFCWFCGNFYEWITALVFLPWPLWLPLVVSSVASGVGFFLDVSYVAWNCDHVTIVSGWVLCISVSNWNGRFLLWCECKKKKKKHHNTEFNIFCFCSIIKKLHEFMSKLLCSSESLPTAWLLWGYSCQVFWQKIVSLFV